MSALTHDNKLGLFIHWGIYSSLGLHEQAQARYSIGREEYESLKDRFNPTEYDPEEWVLLAKSLGMKYICFTAKHHDGFCMWDTKETDYNIMNTPYKKDVLKMLSDACHKHGMLLSIYYSNPDWHHPYGYNPESSHQWAAKYKPECDTKKYREFVKKQIRELLTGYGKIYTFFWDIPPHIEDPSMNELVRSLQPGIFINNRGWSEGDFSTPEREYDAIGNSRYSKMTEACNSVGQHSWGFRKDEDFYSNRYLFSQIDRYMALGASYLLNVGPDGKGRITEDYRKKLMAVGDFYNRMEGCLESAEEDSFDYAPHGAEMIATKKNGKTYLHFYNGIKSSAVALENIPCKPKKIRLMNTGATLKHEFMYLPEFFNTNEEAFGKKALHISPIDVDAIASEPIVIEIEWDVNN